MEDKTVKGILQSSGVMFEEIMRESYLFVERMRYYEQ